MGCTNLSPMLLRPYHTYHESLVYKIFLAGKGAADSEVLPFANALDVIRRVHNWTAGAKQIAYRVGWQFDGPDSKYPAWSEANINMDGGGGAQGPNIAGSGYGRSERNGCSRYAFAEIRRL